MSVSGPNGAAVRGEYSATAAAAVAAAPFVNRSPFLTVAGTSLDVVHTQLSVLAMERAYVVYAGRLLGVIRRSQLGGR